MSSPWICPTCAKGFLRKGDLTRHKLLHTGIKPHVCLDCGKAFSQYSGLKTHKNVHTKLKPFLCGLQGCKAAFGDPSSCARHRKETHQRVAAYRCPHATCRSSIKRRSAFAAHLRKHNINPAFVDIDALTSRTSSTIPHRQPAQRISNQVQATPFDLDIFHHPNTNFCNFPSTPQPLHTMKLSPYDSMNSSPLPFYDNIYTPQAVRMQSIGNGAQYTMGSPSSSLSPPSLVFSSSPSPSTQSDHQIPSSGESSPYQNPLPLLSPLTQSPLMFFPEPAYGAEFSQNRDDWVFEPPFFHIPKGM